ncbi:Pkinase-domain-containing protein [Bimuria novae-zelandiae CBS 107.79]|uniref:Pkinase-domain-containing protein n=1 Tax=Bimuria novae-zelandiae CBS 107.79 TaxID=1447943 RepID=A0A6A5VBG9_9PLEO|nr:Pkinase-domain-containing protein [Bimuria novae-zelandiae CBS 107.79]
MQQPPTLGQPNESEIPGIFTSEHLSLDVPAHPNDGRPTPVKYTSLPAYHSPLRHHKRAASSTRRVKETLNARSEYSNSEDDGTAQHRINQYHIKQEIGRGSFGAVHLAVDQYGQEYAVKEFSKSRLRKRAQSNLLRRPSARRRRQGALAAGLGFNSPLHRHSSGKDDEQNSLDLIKEEIAIMKKLNHPNLVSLIEVLDDPDEDSLYMVMEMCKKGVVMQVGLEERADPYPEEQCRCWFRDMILGLEYLHAQGIIHRDIKPDNCLVTGDDVLKIVDFGVSEMFDKQDQMKTAKSAGSPAFMPPELCVAKHGEVDGKAVDIWSMGVTLFCLLFGRIPFERHGMIELYQAIRMEEPEYDDCNESLKDLLQKLLEKDPRKRITMEQIREHPWVTMNGTDPLLPRGENVAAMVEPTDEEVDAAITGNMGHLVTVVRAVKRFKQLLFRRRPERLEGILGSASRIVQPPLSIRPSGLRKSRSQDADDRRPIEGALAIEGVHHDIEIDNDIRRIPQGVDRVAYEKPGFRSAISSTRSPTKAGMDSSPISSQPVGLTDARVVHENMSYRPSPSKPITIPTGVVPSAPSTPVGKGHAHDPLQDTLFLDIGTGEDSVPPADESTHIVSESPGAVDINVYETAYREEVDRILSRQRDASSSASASSTPARRPTLYLTRRIENVKSIIRDAPDAVFDHGKQPPTPSDLKTGFKGLVEKAKKEIEYRGEWQKLNEGKEGKLSRITRNVREKKRAVEEEREIIRREDREKALAREREEEQGRQGSVSSRSSTPLPGLKGLSRSGTPVQ